MFTRVRAKSKLKKGEFTRILNFSLSLLLIIVILFEKNKFDNNLYILSILYCLLSLFFVVLPQSKINNMAIYIIRITGFARYIVIPYLAKKELIIFSNNKFIYIMVVELLTVYFAIIIFCYKGKSHSKNNLKYSNNFNMKIGLSSLFILIFASCIIFRYQQYLERYLKLSRNKSPLPNINGAFSIAVSIFFIIIFIKSLEFIKNSKLMSNGIKIIISFIISIFFVNGNSITDSNVSRWTMIVTTIISLYYIIRLYPSYVKKIMAIAIPVLSIILIMGTVLKVSSSIGYNNLNIKNIIEKQMTYKNINAYFSGPNNVIESMELNSIIDSNQISRKKILISDIFANFPLLNKLTNPLYNTNSLFNYYHYKSFIAVDQIIPLVGQTYIIFSIFFPVIIFVITYLSLYFTDMIKCESDFLKQYCFIYLAFFLSLGNCLNFTIMLQNVWIHVLPAYIICRLNYRFRIS